MQFTFSSEMSRIHENACMSIYCASFRHSTIQDKWLIYRSICSQGSLMLSSMSSCDSFQVTTQTDDGVNVRYDGAGLNATDALPSNQPWARQRPSYSVSRLSVGLW